jgi:hypothetical protein
LLFDNELSHEQRLHCKTKHLPALIILIAGGRLNVAGGRLNQIILAGSRLNRVVQRGFWGLTGDSLGFPEEHWGTLSTSGNPQLLIEHLRATFRKTPLEILATMLIRYASLLEPVKRLFDAYDRFIGLMAEEAPVFDCKSAREHLEELDVASLETDSVYGEAREIRRAFGKALTEVFLDPKSELYNATIRYGVF